MSTDIATIKGRYESNLTQKLSYREGELHLTRFWGGKENGTMLQLTVVGEHTNYIQLTAKQIEELREVLSQWDNDQVYPSD